MAPLVRSPADKQGPTAYLVRGAHPRNLPFVKGSELLIFVCHQGNDLGGEWVPLWPFYVATLGVYMATL